MMTSSDVITLLGNPTVWSYSLFLATWIYAVAAAMGVLALWRARTKKIRKHVLCFSMAVSIALAIAAIYLAYLGVIGFRTWI